MHYKGMFLVRKLRDRLYQLPRNARRLLLVMSILLLVVLVLPWGTWAGQILRHELATRGIVLESFELERVSLDGALFHNLRISAPVPLEIPTLELGMSKSALFHGEWQDIVSHISISSMKLALSMHDGEWHLNGKALPEMESSEDQEKSDEEYEHLREMLLTLSLFPDVEGNEIILSFKNDVYELHTTLDFSTSRDDKGIALKLNAAPTELTVDGTTPTELAIPFLKADMSWNKDIRQIRAAVNASEISGVQGEQSFSTAFDLAMVANRNNSSSVRVVLADVKYDVTGGIKMKTDKVNLTASARSGVELFPITMVLSAPAVQLENVPAHFAALNMHSVCNVDEERLVCNRLVVSTPTGTISATGMAALELDAPEKVDWTLHGSANNMLGGRFRFEAGSMAGKGINSAKIQIMADRLELQEVLSLLAEGKVSATGTVSGQIPMSWHGQTDIRFGKGSLRADGRGSIRISPELLGMDNPQVAMVSGILQDFRYDQLSISLRPDGEKKGKLPGLKASLSTLGKNPSQLEGHPVKLNVNLSGDLLSVIKQSILPMSDPQQWLQNQQ